MDVLSSQRRQVQFFRHGTGVWQHACAHALLYSVRVQIGQAVPWLIAPEQSLCGVPNLGNHAYAFTTAAGDTVFSGTPGPGVLAHEISHSIDFNAFPQYGSPFSKTPYWTDEYAKDTHTPKAYGRKNWLEDFVVTARVAFYDVYHQYSTYGEYVGDIVKPGGTCSKRIKDSPRVKKDGSPAPKRAERRVTNIGIKNISTPPEYDNIILYNYEEEKILE